MSQAAQSRGLEGMSEGSLPHSPPTRGQKGEESGPRILPGQHGPERRQQAERLSLGGIAPAPRADPDLA